MKGLPLNSYTPGGPFSPDLLPGPGTGNSRALDKLPSQERLSFGKLLKLATEKSGSDASTATLHSPSLFTPAPILNISCPACSTPMTATELNRANLADNCGRRTSNRIRAREQRKQRR